EVIEKEKAIYREQAKEQGRPEKVWDRIVSGKLEKFFEENCLVEQAYIRDEDVKIKELIAETIQKTGENINLRRFVRWQLGEELEGM
ncbi:MAG TPA: elongation factor Ts, partial [Proteobacteria bacterium]|nr:elongation factor Ts [Pseudomonadota bacterium]